MIKDAVAEVRERIAAAAARVGRDPHSITLMAVTKTVDRERIRQASEAGIRVFGENRVQEFEEKFPDPDGRGDAEWHLIGHLQTNKAGKAAEIFDAVDSLDSLRLAEKLDPPGRRNMRLRPHSSFDQFQSAQAIVWIDSLSRQILRARRKLIGKLPITGSMSAADFPPSMPTALRHRSAPSCAPSASAPSGCRSPSGAG